MTDRYLILNHTADGKFRAFGGTLEEAFANAALACASLMWDWAKVVRRVEHRVDVAGSDPGQVLYKFLEEILYLLDVKKFLLGGVEDLKIEYPAAREEAETGFRLSARLLGDDEPSRYEIHGSVKAITYNEMKIERACDAWTVQVVVDM